MPWACRYISLKTSTSLSAGLSKDSSSPLGPAKSQELGIGNWAKLTEVNTTVYVLLRIILAAVH